MDLRRCTREILALFLLIQSTTSDNASLDIVATCTQSEDELPGEWLVHSDSNPSPIHELTANLSESQTSVIIRWAIKVDSSIRSLNGTWISFYWPETFYRCEYEPPFTSELTKLSGLQQLWFNFTVQIGCPLTKYDVSAYNLPPPDTDNKYSKTAETAEIEWNAHIYAAQIGDRVVVIFNTSFVADQYIITLKDNTQSLQTIEEQRECKAESCKVELEYTGPCENLTILITPHFENCEEEMIPVKQKVDCKNTLLWVIIVRYVLALLFILLGCCIMYQVQRCVRESKRRVSARVLLLYPAVDSEFQRAVMILAELLQSRGGVTVVIDVWDSRSLAEQGPLRWINTQIELADRVLIISPPQHKRIDVLKLGMTDLTVSASASNLFALALNLVSSAACDPHGRDKFWVINLDQEERSVQAELRGLRVFVLPREQKKLHQQLMSGDKTSSALERCCSTFHFKNSVGQLEISPYKTVQTL